MRRVLTALSFGGSTADKRKHERRATDRGGLWRAITHALSTAALLAVAIPSLALGQTNNEGLPVIPVQIVNNYNTAQTLFVYIHGIVQQQTNTLPPNTGVYVTDINGDIAITPVIGPAYKSLAVEIGTGQSTTIFFPKISGRIYLSVGQPLTVCCKRREAILANLLAGSRRNQTITSPSTGPNRLGTTPGIPGWDIRRV